MESDINKMPNRRLLIKAEASSFKRVNRRGIHRQRRTKSEAAASSSNNNPRQQRQSLQHSFAVSSNSIHGAWKKSLGGLIRWLANFTPEYRDDPEAAMRMIEQLYTERNCDVEQTKYALLSMILQQQQDSKHQNSRTANLLPPSEWLELQMAVEAPPDDNIKREVKKRGKPSQQKWVALPCQEQAGEGAARQHERWKVVTVPAWAHGRPYFFNVINRSPLDLTCQMTIDGSHLAARNAPVPKQSEIRIRPDNHRYFVQHQWRFQTAQRTPLMLSASNGDGRMMDAVKTEEVAIASAAASIQPKNQYRYNHRRPLSYLHRVSFTDFPDPTHCGWTFTGSNEASTVEFFEKVETVTAPNGSKVLLDFYYTTGTVKTVLDHPVRGRNQLFRKCQVQPDLYQKILSNPRVHTDIGYRTNNIQQKANQRNPSVGENMDEVMEDQQEAPVMDESTVVPVAPRLAQDPNYKFDEAGHANRQQALSQMGGTQVFSEWEKASQKDWACVHAKFFVSLKQARRGANVAQTGKGNARRAKPKEELPNMTPIVDVKASEKARLSTEFHPQGGRVNNSRSSSHIRMQKVRGLNDDPAWEADPVFEVKLYYRPQPGAAPSQNGDDDDDSMVNESGGDNDSMDDEGDVPLADRLAAQMPLETYQQERCQQVDQWHRNFQCDPLEGRYEQEQLEEAESERSLAMNAIQASTTVAQVDHFVKCYFDWFQEQEWRAKQQKEQKQQQG